MKKLVASMLIGLFAATSIVCSAIETGDEIRNGIIRLHVRANSNSEEDQALKLKVRDAVLHESAQITKGITDKKAVRDITERNLERLANAARDEIAKNGFDYKVRVRLGKAKFPSRVYESFALPAGTYEALTVDIGSGEGDNWWCVMFPPLCFAREAFAKSDEDADEVLSEILSPDAYSMIAGDKIEIKFKVYEIVEKIISRD